MGHSEIVEKRGMMFLWILFLVSAAVSAPADEFQAILNEADFVNEASLKQIVPGGYSPSNANYFIKPSLSEIVDKDKPSYKRLMEVVKKGHTALGLTFNIYDDNLREAAIALFRFLLEVDDNKYESMTRWARVHINADMFDYATRLAFIYGNKFKDIEILPPFIRKPNHFVIGEALWKAMHLKVAYGEINEADGKLNQYSKSGNEFIVNTNYSGWNLLQNGCDQEINYFKEDIALNSYYYGVHLLHPFWMTNEELDQLNPRHAEHYYFTHKQLMARYKLEKEHLKRNPNGTRCDIDLNVYNSYLMHDYGLPFPIKSPVRGEWNDERARLKSIVIAIRECISRGVILDNGTAVPMGDYNIDLLSKLVRANLDSPKSAKIIRSLYGYGNEGYPTDEYNSAPSVLHYPHTSLRDQTYWHLLQSLLEYFTEYKQTLEPYSIVDHQDKNISIVNHHFDNITTYFDYYKFSLNKGLGGGVVTPAVFAARQRRLKHLPFHLNFTIESKMEKDVVVRLFLGPQCELHECWSNYDKFFELDTYKISLKNGVNSLSWSTDNSQRFSSDDFYNLDASEKRKNNYNIFKFPKNLAIPRGLKEGLNLTLFIMVTEVDRSSEDHATPASNYYKHSLNEVDGMPLGFPFHRQVKTEDESITNCKFYNISIYHESRSFDDTGLFSPNLY